MKKKILTEEGSKKLVCLTWLAIVFGGVIVYIFTDPLKEWILLAGPVVIIPLVNFWVKSAYIPVRVRSAVSTVFLPTAVLTGCAALICILLFDKFLNSWSLALFTVCAACIMAIFPESKYADY